MRAKIPPIIPAELNPEMIARLRAIDWFVSCGKPLDLRLSMDVTYVHTWKEASRYFHNHNWEDTTLEAQNAITEFLFIHYRNDLNDKWNNIAAAGRNFIQTEIEPKLRIVQERFSLDQEFLATIRWDILGAILEDAYLYRNIPIRFSLELLKVYEVGHFPCGWEGEWPHGKLLIF